MSDTVFKIISTNPSYLPDELQLNAAKVFCDNIFDKERTEIILTDTIEYIDQGENFDHVSCNLCGKKIEADDWQGAMDVAFQKQFEDLLFVTKCCQQTTSLNNLRELYTI